jgi:hypothetical protein
MKRIAMLIMAILAIAVLVAPQAYGQKMQFNPNDNQFFYYHPLATSKAYAASQTDTLPHPLTTGTAVTLKAGGAGMVTLSGSALDSCSGHLYVDKRIIGGTTWTNILDDSLVSTSAGIHQEWNLRTMLVDVIAGMDVEFRVRIAFNAWNNGGGGKPATKKYTLAFNWKP